MAGDFYRACGNKTPHGEHTFHGPDLKLCRGYRPPPPSGWQEGFLHSLVDYVLAEGKTSPDGSSEYSDEACDGHALTSHLAVCSVDYATASYSDRHWTTFSGTFASPPWEPHEGLEVTASCACGQITARQWRWEGSYAEMLRALTGDGS